MTRDKIICLHGINVYTPHFADDLILSAGGSTVGHWVPISWAHNVFDELLSYRELYHTPPVRWHRPSSWGRSAIAALHESLAWVRAYEDPGVQERVLNTVTARVKIALNKNAYDRLHFVGHSLGSVVAVDAIGRLIRTGALAPQQVASITTMGSPLHMWKAPRKLQTILSDVPCKGRWINLYDPDDAIAGKLSPLDRRIEDHEISTGGIIRAHCGYWTSPVVARIIKSQILAA